MGAMHVVTVSVASCARHNVSEHLGATTFDGQAHGRAVAVEPVRLWLGPRKRVH